MQIDLAISGVSWRVPKQTVQCDVMAVLAGRCSRPGAAPLDKSLQLIKQGIGSYFVYFNMPRPPYESVKVVYNSSSQTNSRYLDYVPGCLID